MRRVIFAASAAGTGLAYADAGSCAFLAGLLGWYRLCDRVRATKYQSRGRWAAYRVLCSMAGRDDPGPWVKPVPLTLATEGGD